MHFPCPTVQQPIYIKTAAKHSSKSKQITFNSFSHYLFSLHVWDTLPLWGKCCGDQLPLVLSLCLFQSKIKHSPLPLPLLLSRSDFWWEGKEQRSHRPTLAKVNDLRQTHSAPSYQKPQFEGCGISKVTAKQTARKRANGWKELHQIHPTAQFSPISKNLFCRDPMNSQLIAI